ncbi:MAG: colicin V synthesis protein [Epsilonproteobacteria bacterium]|nr:colicin V synthesis protein [Campylobacterota bacterium]NPA63946.1 CvpA family protein [Campylobacterota bacterium]
MEQLSTFDIVIGAIILLLGLKGLIDGFVKEFFGLAGIIGGIYYGSRYAQQIGEFIHHNIFPIKNEAALTFIGFLVGLFAIWIAMVLLGNIVSKLTSASGMGMINKLLGLLFGWAKIFLIFSVIIYALSSMEVTKRVIEKYTKNSLLYPLMMEAGGYIIKLKPQDLVSNDIKEKGSQTTTQIKEETKKSAIETAKERIVKEIEENLSKEK